MHKDQAKDAIDEAHMILNAEPQDRLDYLVKALQVKQVILRCTLFLEGLKTSPFLGEYTEEDLAIIHESFCDSALPLVLMMEHFVEKAELAADRYSLAV